MRASPSASSAKLWAKALAEWAIPPEILARAPVSPWEFPPGVLERRADLNHLWLHFHGLARPARPTADDAEAVLREAGLEVERQDWTPSDPSTWFETLEEAAGWTARALCLSGERRDELTRLIEPDLLRLDGMVAQAPRPRATIWWKGE